MALMLVPSLVSEQWCVLWGAAFVLPAHGDLTPAAVVGSIAGAPGALVCRTGWC